MPVHHEKTERNTQEPNSRDASKHRTKQREISVERRPIISQEKPHVSKQTTKAVTRKPDQKTAKPVPQKNSTVAQSKQVLQKKSTATQQKPAVQLKPKASSSTTQQKPKTLPKTKEVSKPEPSTKLKRPANKISPRSSNQDQKLANKVSKSDYLNEEKSAVRTAAKTHDRSRTRTLSPSEVKILPLKKEVIEGKVGDKVDAESEPESQDQTDYEDDFEDYESDFEEDDETETEDTDEPEKKEETAERKRILVSSAEERERKLDSGSYHISAVPHKKEMEEIKMAMQNENHPQRKQLLAEEADEGYLEGEKRAATMAANKSKVLDFNAAGKRHKEQLINEKAMKRGEQILKMITLDMITYSLLDIPAVPYEQFMASFGRSNTTQVHVQTNEDDCEEETQTDGYDVTEKWTQVPATFSSTVQKDGSLLYSFSKEDRLGVGGLNNFQADPVTRFSQISLAKSLIKSSRKILIWLENQSNRDLLSKGQKKSELSCCEAMTVLSQAKTKQSPVLIIATSSSHLVLSVEKTIDDETIMRIWSVLTPSSPIQILICRREVTSVCFGPGRADIVFAGATDGSINLWDLREPNEHHSEEIGRSPTYSTTEVLKNTAHEYPITSVIILTKEEHYDDFRPIQICSLDLHGKVIVWSVVQQVSQNIGVPNSDCGLAPWGRVRLVMSSCFSANEIGFSDSSTLRQFTTMVSRGETGNEILIGINNGNVLHCLSDGLLLKPKFYEPSKNSRPSAVTAISVFLVDRRFFLVGCDDGTVRFYNVNRGQPLINLHWNMMVASPTSSIKALHWFPTKPCIFFVVDATARIHVWNLSVSDIYPETTVPASTQNPVTSAAVLNPRSITQTGSIVLGRANGNIEVHNIKTVNDKAKAISDWKKESKMFQRYAKIL